MAKRCLKSCKRVKGHYIGLLIWWCKRHKKMEKRHIPAASKPKERKK